ncbi:hypothetical protein BXT86_00995 [candidate division WOR-3 bacterium 4484_100]|uniref:HAMP domain-containing protein n=1 Tax=candidate division WOR-3 bacterium 4484_100 TaxID=1936077 RepID=A0A1V4QIC1_UNCW3|nr:MAG: hypothetical protein BXT86_00995 [candidate division WOR-3 bacterium 4484_100]
MAFGRRRIIIIHGLQIQLIVAIMGLIIGVSLILLASMCIIFEDQLTILGVSSQTIGEAWASTTVPLVIIGIILFFMSLWAVILISHKIYGPLYRLSRYIKRISNGEKTEDFEFRKGDAIDGLKEIYNELRRNLEKTLHYNYSEMVNIFSELEDILDRLYNKEIPERELYTTLQNICNRTAKALDITSEAIEEQNR